MTTPYLQLADLIQKLKDPDREKREALLKLIQSDPTAAAKLKANIGDDPKALDAVLGQAPRFGGLLKRTGKEYESAKSLIQNAPPDAATLANKFQSNELKDLLGLQALNNPDIANASARVDMSNVSPGLINTYGPEQQMRYQEAQATAPSGRIQTLTPKEREIQKAQLEGQQAGTAASTAAKNVSEFNLNQAKVAKAEQDADDALANVAFAKWGTAGRLAQAVMDKKVDTPTLIAIQNYRKGAGGKILDDARDQWYKEQLLEIDRGRNSSKFNLQDALNKADIAFVTNLSEKMGGKIAPTETFNLYKQIRENPGLQKQLTAMPEPDPSSPGYAAWKVNDEITNFKKKIEPKEIAKLRLDFQGKIAPLLKSIREGTVDDEQIPGIIQDINNISESIYRPYQIEPVKYGIKPVAKGGISGFFGGKSKVPVPISADPILQQAGDKIDPENLSPEQQGQLAEEFHVKYPGLSAEEIKKKVLAGERP